MRQGRGNSQPPKEESFLNIFEYIERERTTTDQNRNSNDRKYQPQVETNILFVGEKDSGKSSLINLFLGRKEKAGPTIAPSFRFAQKDGVKANIWEMGRIVHEDIAAIPLRERNEKTVIVAIVLDLSKPENIVTSLSQWFTFLHLALSSNEPDDPTISGSKHDLEKLPFPVLIIGNKYDKFKNEESVKRKIICTALRYMSSTTTSCLIFSSTKDKVSRDNFKKVARARFFSNLSNDKFWKGNARQDSGSGNMPIQNKIPSSGPLLIYPAPQNSNYEKHDEAATMNDIMSCLPSKIKNFNMTMIDRNELFHTNNNNSVARSVEKWVSLCSSVFGRSKFVLRNEQVAVEMTQKLKLYPNEEIDELRLKADEEIERIQRKQRDSVEK